MLDCETLAIIEEIVNQIAGVSASPGFTWGRSGNLPDQTFLLNDTVPSNVSGRQVPVQTGQITTVFVVAEDPGTYDVRIFKHPSPFTTLTAVSMVPAYGRAKTFSLTAPLPNVSNVDELGAQIINGSAKNAVVGCIIRGTL